MKARSIRYLSFEGLKNVWVNRLMSIASVGVLMACMLLIGVVFLLAFNVEQALDTLEQQNVVMVYLEDSLTETSDFSRLEANLQAIPNVSKVEFVPKEDALEAQLEEIDPGSANYFEFLEGDNPLPNAFQVTLSDLTLMSETTSQIQGMDGIASVRDQQELANKINSISSAVTWVAIGFIAILLIVSLVIITNTIRITMHNRRKEISIMKAVGATNGFIRFPFVIEGAVLGIVAGLLATLLLYSLYRVAGEALATSFGFSLIPFSSYMWLLLGVFGLIGIGAGVIGSLISMGKYLKREGSEFMSI